MNKIEKQRVHDMWWSTHSICDLCNITYKNVRITAGYVKFSKTFVSVCDSCLNITKGALKLKRGDKK